MISQSSIEGWMLLAEEGKMFHGETVLKLLKYIKELEEIVDELTIELESYLFDSNDKD